MAGLLDVEYRILAYHLYVTPSESRYKTFTLRKRSGGVRNISAPANAIKILQSKLNQVLQAVYQPRFSVYGFTRQRNIRGNALVHARQRYVFNIDLEDFFPSINFGRVRGLFLSKPYELPAEVATVLAQICCFNDQLPQGAPTSPVLSNMICSRMDGELQRLAKKHRCYYTRYVDDISFSTSLPKFPENLGIRAASDSGANVTVGLELDQVVTQNGFQIDDAKVRLRTRARRQEVTGLTINSFPNVRRKFVNQIRAMLHAWDGYGLDVAESEFRSKYDRKQRSPGGNPPSFRHVVKGKIEFLGMVRGKTDPIYLRFMKQLQLLAPDLVNPDIFHKSKSAAYSPTGVLVNTEGVTDWKHLKKALSWLQEQGRFVDLNVEFQERSLNDRWGSGELKNFCAQNAKIPQSKPIIGIFDRDEDEILGEVTTGDASFKHWGNKVFSLAIPVPSHRQDTPNVCIELYYEDSEIKRLSPEGRRLYLSNEFDGQSGRHTVDADLNCLELNKIKANRLSIIDSRVSLIQIQ